MRANDGAVQRDRAPANSVHSSTVGPLARAERRSAFKWVRDELAHMPRGDPYSPVRPFVYECVGCRLRMQANRQPQICPECGCVMTDLSVPRE